MNNYLRVLLLPFLLLISYHTVKAQFGFGEELVKLKVYSSFDNLHRNSELKIALKINIEENWHINSNKPNEDFLIATEVNLLAEKFNLTDVNYPEPKELKFSFSDIPMSVYEDEILVGGIVKIPRNFELGKYSIPIELTYQACNDVTCMPPSSIVDTITISVVDNKTAVNEVNSEIFANLELKYSSEDDISEDDESIGSTLEDSGLIISLILVFLGGLALNLTPCVYPLIPITIGYFGGQSEGRTSKLLILGVLYVLGMALTYSIVGVVTSLSGAIFGALLQNPIVILAIVAILVALSLSMFGFYEFKLPDAWVAKAGGAKAGGVGAFLMGLTMGIVAAPCIGPFVIGLVTYVAAKGDPLYGFLMFFVLAVGLGTPYLFLALFSGKIKNLPKAGFWMEAIQHIFGIILIGMAIYFLGPILPKDIGTYALWIFMILASLYLIFIDKVANDIKGFRIFKIIFSILIITLSVYMLWPVDKQSPEWMKYSDQSYEESIAENKPIMIDFYADWCIPCKELDALTFSDKRVIELSKKFTVYKVDMTKTLSEETEKIRNKFNIKGMPTILIIDNEGKEIERITGFIDADEMLSRMKKVKSDI